MSFFSRALQDLFDRYKKRAIDLHKATGISQSQISNWMSGLQTSVTEEDMRKICLAFTKDPYEHAKLIAAHLQDECYGPGSHLVEVSIKGRGVLKEDPPPYRVTLAPAIAHDFDVLAEHVMKNRHLREAIHGFARLCETGSLGRIKKR